MAKTTRVNETLKKASAVRNLWETIPKFTMGDVTLKDFVAAHDATDELAREYAKMDLELTGVKNNRDKNIRVLNDLVTRFRSGMRSIYGPDSAQYEQAGGTPTHARKAPKRAGDATVAGTAAAPTAPQK